MAIVRGGLQRAICGVALGCAVFFAILVGGGGFQAAVMVGGHFGDDVGGVVVADGAVVDLHGVVLCKERKGGF